MPTPIGLGISSLDGPHALSFVLSLFFLLGRRMNPPCLLRLRPQSMVLILRTLSLLLAFRAFSFSLRIFSLDSSTRLLEVFTWT